MATKTVFQAGAVPQSLYGLGGDINTFRQKDLESLFSAPLSISNWALNAAGVPVQQTTPQGSLYNIQTYGGAGGGGTYATGGGQTGSNPYYQQASSLWNQLGTQAQNLIGQGQSEYQTGTSIVDWAEKAFGQGQGVYSQGVQELQSIISQYPEIESQLNQLPSYKAIMSTGLTPEQRAYVTQATQAQRAAVTQQLQSEGLGSSTMLAEKLGAADQAGAATAGSLIQGNIQAATGAANAAANAVQERINQEQQMAGVAGATVSAGLGQETAATAQINAGATEQNLGLNSQTAGASFLNTIATANINMQQQLFSEAMQGYGVLGQFLQTQMSTYGLQLQGEQIKGQESAASAQTSASLKTAQGAADAQGFSGLLSGIGSLLGGKSGLAGAGGLTSLFGGGAAAGGAAIAGGSTTAIGGAAAGAAGGAVAGGGSAIGAALSVAGALFCAVGREIFGVENPEWYLWRDVMLFKAPKWFRKAYIRHAQTWALYLSTRPRLKALVRTIMRRILKTLTHAESGIFKKY